MTAIDFHEVLLGSAGSGKTATVRDLIARHLADELPVWAASADPAGLAGLGLSLVERRPHPDVVEFDVASDAGVKLKTPLADRWLTSDPGELIHQVRRHLDVRELPGFDSRHLLVVLDGLDLRALKRHPARWLQAAWHIGCDYGIQLVIAVRNLSADLPDDLAMTLDTHAVTTLLPNPRTTPAPDQEN